MTIRVLGETVSRSTIREIVTPDGIPIKVIIADAGTRLVAALIDAFLIFFATILLIVLLWIFGIGALFTQFGETLDVLKLLVPLTALIQLLARLAVLPAFEFAWQGRTIGKRMLGLRVIDRQGGALSFERVVARNLTREVELWLPLTLLLLSDGTGEMASATFAVLIALMLLSIIPLTNKERMRGGDFLAGTWVIVEPTGAKTADVAGERAVFSEDALKQYGREELEVLANVLRDTGPNAREMQRVVAARIRKRIGARGLERNDKKFMTAYYSALRDYLEHKLAATGQAPSSKDEARSSDQTTRRR